MKNLLILLSAIVLSVSCATQKNKSTSATPVFEGKLVYSLTYEDLPAEYEAYASMFPKEMTMYVKGEKSRTEQPSAMGNTVTIVDSKAKSMFIIMDMMGMKNAYKMTAEDIDKQKVSDEKPVIVYTDETKTIAGYNCKKAEITQDGVTSSVFFTEEIPSGLSKNFGDLKGFPMEYTIKANGLTVVTEVKSVSPEKISDKMFIVPEGYEIKPYSEFPSMGG